MKLLLVMCNMYKYTLIMIFLSFVSTLNAQKITNLRTDLRIAPIAIDNIQPSLSWTIEAEIPDVKQVSYHILVASTAEKLEKGEADLWDSGEVKSSQSINVTYNGVRLHSRQECFWKVKIRTNRGKIEWSPIAKWTMGLLDKSDWKGKWIGLNQLFEGDTITRHSRLSARYLRKEFNIEKKIKKATAYIIGLGLYELYFNGNRIGNQVLSPTPTNYAKNIYYNSFDVTSNLNEGSNAIGVILGNGRFFYMRQEFDFQKSKDRFPKLLFQLDIEYTDETCDQIVSDVSWKVTPFGPIRSNNEYDGEEYDARINLLGWDKAHFNTDAWLSAETVSAPEGEIMSQTNENMTIHQSIKPVSIITLPNGNHILDMGYNMTGWLKLKAKGKNGDEIILRFGESLDENGKLYSANLRTALQKDIYILHGDGWEEWEPRFTYHGFRYVEIEGFPGKPTVDNFEGRLIYDNIRTVGSFLCSDDLLNRIYQNAYRTICNNYKGMPVDCPQRDERDPWLGDWATTSIGASYALNIQSLYRKWLRDIRFAQRDNGQLPDVIPEFTWTAFKDNMTWPGTYIMLGNMLLKQYADTVAIRDNYPYMKKWMGYMQKKYLKENILTRDRYGDWCVPPESMELIHSEDPARQANGELIATAYFYYFLQLLSDFANVSGNSNDVSDYQSLATAVKEAFNKKFYNSKTSQYDNNTVTANLLPLAMGLVEKENEEVVFAQIVKRIVNEDNMHISTGVIGSQWLMRELTKRGRADIAMAIATQTGYPSWGYMLENGATTIWELWNGHTADPVMNSHNHVMLLGDLLVWMYEDLAGIKNNPTENEFGKLLMKPQLAGNLTEVRATTETPHGIVKSEWNLKNGVFTWHVTIPANSRANIFIPAESIDVIKVDGKKINKMESIRFIGTEDNRQNIEVGSGSYTFVSKYHL